MRLCSFATTSGTPGLGIVEGDEVVDPSATDVPSEPAAALAEIGRVGLEKLAAGAPRLPLADVRLLAPASPRKFLGDRGSTTPTTSPRRDGGARSARSSSTSRRPAWSARATTMHMPKVSDTARLRGRAGIVIGKRCRHVPAEQAPRGDRRLHDRQRRQRARLAVQGADDDDRQVLRHPRAARPLARHARRGRRPAGPRAPHLRQRGAAPGRAAPARWSSTASSRSPPLPRSPSSPAT